MFPYAHNLYFYFVLPYLGEFGLDEEKSVATLREPLEDIIRDINNSHQPLELVVSCPSLRTRFH